MFLTSSSHSLLKHVTLSVTCKVQSSHTTHVYFKRGVVCVRKVGSRLRLNTPHVIKQVFLPDMAPFKNWTLVHKNMIKLSPHMKAFSWKPLLLLDALLLLEIFLLPVSSLLLLMLLFSHISPIHKQKS